MNTFTDVTKNSQLKVTISGENVLLLIECNDNTSNQLMPTLTFKSSVLLPLFSQRECLGLNLEFNNQAQQVRAELFVGYDPRCKALQFTQEISKVKHNEKIRCVMSAQCLLDGMELYRFITLLDSK